MKKWTPRALALLLALLCALPAGVFAAPDETESVDLDTLLTSVGTFAHDGAALLAALGTTAEVSEAVNAANPGDEAYPMSGTVDGGTINVRSGPGTDSERLTQVYTGKVVTILGREGDWYHVSFDGYDGYINSAYLHEGEVEVAQPAAETPKYPMTGTVSGGTINVRSAPSTDALCLTQVYTGNKVAILAPEGEWYRVSLADGREGYVFGEYLLEGDVDVAASGVGAKVAQDAQKYLGVRYVYGGASPSGFDCSGLTLYLYAQYGYSLSHSARAQYAAGRKISKSELQPGDLVFFSSPSTSSINHVGIYIGNGEVLHARQSLGRVTINSLSENYYSRYYYGACRIAG